NRRRALKACLLVVLVFGLTCGLYLVDYHPGGDKWRSDPTTVYKHPLYAAKFYCALLGAPIAQAATAKAWITTPWLGAALCAAFVGLVAAAARQRIFVCAVPWISLGLFSLGFAAMTTIGRSGWKIPRISVDSHYMISSVLLSVAVV